MDKIDYIQIHHQRKDDLITLLKECSEILQKVGQENSALELENMIQQTKNGKFSIVVVGAFSAGKSTILNALMGERLLPSFNKETTATINFLESAEENNNGQEMIEVNYKDGHSEKVTPVNRENLEQYGSTQGDDVARKIDSITIYIKGSQFLNDGVRLVDSPGLNGMAQGHSEKTERQINESHAAIYVFSAHQSSGTAHDFRTLRDLKNKCNSVFIVLNQIDCIKMEESTVEANVEDLKKNLVAQFPDEPLPEIYPIAAWPALVYRSKQNLMYNNEHRSQEFKEKIYKESRIEAFEERLMRYLVNGEKTIIELTAPITKAIAFLNNSIDTLKQESLILSDDGNLEEVKARKAEISKELAELNKNIKEQESKLKIDFNDLVTDTVSQLKAETKQIAEKYINIVEREADFKELCEHAQTYINRINGEYHTVYEETIDQVNKKFLKITQNVLENLSLEVQERINSAKIRPDDDDLIRIKLDENLFEVDLDLSSLYDAIDSVNNSRRDIEDNIDELDVKIARAQRTEHQLEVLDQKMEDARDWNSTQLQNMGARPTVQKREVITEKRSSGFAGFCKWLWNGNPPKQVISYVDDYTAQEHYDAERKRLQEEYTELKERYETQKRNLRVEEDSVTLIAVRSQQERKMAQIERERERLEQQLERETAKQKNKLARKAKEYLNEIIEKINKESRSRIIEKINDFDAHLTTEALIIVKANIREALEQKERELADCENVLTSAGDEKEKRRQLIATQIEDLEKYLEVATSMKAEFDSIQRDEIELM